MTGVHGRVSEHIPEERAIGVGVSAAQDDMCAPNHELSLVTPERPRERVVHSAITCGTKMIKTLTALQSDSVVPVSVRAV